MTKILNSKHFQLFTAALVLMLLLTHVFQEGLFMDGLIYSTIAHNMANGMGTFFYPSFSETIMRIFYEHPPLAMGIQSLFFKAFGDAFYIEKIYSFLTGIFSIGMIVVIWKMIAPSSSIKKIYWLPVLLWIIVPTIPWSYNNNMLENTMALFAMIACYLSLISIEKKGLKRFFLLFLASLFIFFAFLSKGFPGLYPLALFGIYWVAFPNSVSIKKVLTSTFILFVFIAFIFSLYIYLNTDALHNLQAYINSQVIGSIDGIRDASSRWNLFANLARELVVPLILLFILYVYHTFFLKKKISKNKSINKAALFFLLLALASSLPLLVSPKQNTFYIVPSIAFYTSFMALIISPIILEILSRIDVNGRKYKLFYYFNIGMIVLAFIITIVNYGGYSRGKDMIQDIDKIAEVISNKEVISISNSLLGNWELIGQFQRKYYINIDIYGTMNNYLLIPKGDALVTGYEEQNIGLKSLILLKKK